MKTIVIIVFMRVISIEAAESVYVNIIRKNSPDNSEMIKLTRSPSSAVDSGKLLNFKNSDTYKLYYFLDNLESCTIQKFSEGKLEEVPSENFKNSAIEAKRLKNLPDYFGFKIQGRIYVTPLSCLAPIENTK